MLAAGAPSAGNSAAQVKRSWGGQGSGSTNGRAVCKCSGPGKPMRAAAALRRGTGWLRWEAGPEGGTAPAIHAPVPYTRARRPRPAGGGSRSRRGPAPEDEEGVGRWAAAAPLLLLSAAGNTPDPQNSLHGSFQRCPGGGEGSAPPRTGKPVPGIRPRPSAPTGGGQGRGGCPPRAAPGETRPPRPCGDGTCPPPTGTSSSHAADPLCRAGSALRGRGAGGAAGAGARRDVCGWEWERRGAAGTRPSAMPQGRA